MCGVEAGSPLHPLLRVCRGQELRAFLVPGLTNPGSGSEGGEKWGRFFRLIPEEGLKSPDQNHLQGRFLRQERPWGALRGHFFELEAGASRIDLMRESSGTWILV